MHDCHASVAVKMETKTVLLILYTSLRVFVLLTSPFVTVTAGAQSHTCDETHRANSCNATLRLTYTVRSSNMQHFIFTFVQHVVSKDAITIVALKNG